MGLVDDDNFPNDHLLNKVNIQTVKEEN